MGGFTNFLSSTILCLNLLLTFFPTICISLSTLTSTQPLTINQTLQSPNQIFELGFFSSTNSTWYLGIWYKNIPDKTIVWVANRDAPVSTPTGILRIGDHGNIVLLDRTGNIVWLSNQTQAENPVGELLDSGNLVVREANENNPSNFLWQSYDYPTDTLLPGMKLGSDLDRGINRYLTSWKSKNDPSKGQFSFKLELRGFSEFFVWNKQGKRYRSGPWNGERFSGVPEMEPTNSMRFNFTSDAHEDYYSFSINNNLSLFSRLVMNSSGDLQRFTWIESSQVWNLFWYAPKDQCDHYKECGPYGICDSNLSPVCECLKGFSPKNQQAWNLRDGSDGCVRNTGLACEKDKFLLMSNMKLPESSNAFVDRGMGIEQCEDSCLKNCSCTAYANADVRNGGSGCVIWIGELIDMRHYAEGGQDLYVRLAASEIGDDGGMGSEGDSNKRKHIIVVVGIAVGAAIVVAGLITCFCWKIKKLQNVFKGKKEHKGCFERSQDLVFNEVVVSSKRECSGESNQDELELPLFDFGTIVMATNNFSEENKLGQGGFGSVYRGRLVEGREIAVKRLSKNSGQGIEEFKNEVKSIARLQHRNLVRLFGCCIEMDEKMLIYEYMANRSLDSILFSKAKRSILDWRRRFDIIRGIARGLVYLHQDSRFRIVHRDLKASNILLDAEMNPRISDFGMARIFGTDQTEANTRRVVGTYGYMSPEYAMDGQFSVKSDVFSFGVLVLEVVSGKKNRGFYYSNSELNLLGQAWKLWKEGNGTELLDSSVGDSYSASEVLRCLKVGLLCVQERAEDRPTMSNALLMLSSENPTMPEPKNPGFCVGRNVVETDSSSSKQDESCTVNQVTVTILDAR